MAEPQPVPINAMFQDDFVTQLAVVLDTDTMDEVAAKVAHHVVGRRQPDRGLPMVVRYQGKVVPATTTVADVGFGPMHNVYVEWGTA
jgi:toluene monooxygenase system protein B